MYNDRNTVVTRDRQYEVMDPHSETEQAGYIPPQIQIENMILAGQRLAESRRAQFDFESADDIDEDAYDPTRSGNYDLADASQASLRIQDSLLEQEAARKAAVKASQTDQEASQEPPPTPGA